MCVCARARALCVCVLCAVCVCVKMRVSRRLFVSAPGSYESWVAINGIIFFLGEQHEVSLGFAVWGVLNGIRAIDEFGLCERGVLNGKRAIDEFGLCERGVLNGKFEQ